MPERPHQVLIAEIAPTPAGSPVSCTTASISASPRSTSECAAHSIPTSSTSTDMSVSIRSFTTPCESARRASRSAGRRRDIVLHIHPRSDTPKVSIDTSAVSEVRDQILHNSA
eukprot:7386793-Prymnesium_polylepis.2